MFELSFVKPFIGVLYMLHLLIDHCVPNMYCASVLSLCYVFSFFTLLHLLVCVGALFARAACTPTSSEFDILKEHLVLYVIYV